MKNLSGRFEALWEKPGSTVPYYSRAEFSMHELMEYLLHVGGPARVRISTFSLSEIALRTLFRLIESGQVTGLECILDITVKRHRLGLLYFASNMATTIALTKNHAKILLLDNDQHRWVVVGSANMNVNDKIEAGILSSDPGLYARFSAWFDDELQTSVLKISPDEFK